LIFNGIGLYMDRYNPNLISDLSDYNKFCSFLSEEFNEIAGENSAEVTLDMVRSSRFAFDQYTKLYEMFGKAVGGTPPSEFKVAASLCFALRRAQLVVSVRRAGIGESGIHSGLEQLVNPIDPDSNYGLFYAYANELCAFKIGLRIALYFYAHSKIADLEGRTEDEKLQMLVSAMEKSAPRFSKNFIRDNLASLRDHAVSPFSLYILYQAIFDLAVPLEIREVAA
jgi:hypothetical protein